MVQGDVPTLVVSHLHAERVLDGRPIHRVFACASLSTGHESVVDLLVLVAVDGIVEKERKVREQVRS